jgi:hypothetical protein
MTKKCEKNVKICQGSSERSEPTKVYLVYFHLSVLVKPRYLRIITDNIGHADLSVSSDLVA